MKLLKYGLLGTKTVLEMNKREALSIRRQIERLLSVDQISTEFLLQNGERFQMRIGPKKRRKS